MDVGGKRKFEVSVHELLEEKRVAFIEPDGREIIEGDQDSSTQFAVNVAKVDFHEKEPPHKKKKKIEDVAEDEPQGLSEVPQRWPFERALENTRQAFIEIDSMISLIDMVQKREHLSLLMIPKPALTLEALANNLSYRVLSKQQQLQKASTELQKAAARMAALNNKQDNYYSQLLQLRKHWKLKTKAASPLTVLVDWSHPLDSDAVPGAAETELFKTSDGNISIRLPSFRLNKDLIVYSSTDCVQGTKGERSQGNAEGGTHCNALLSNAMHTRFCGELFQQLIQDRMQSGSSYLHLLDNAIKYEDDNNDSVSFKFGAFDNEQYDSEGSLSNEPALRTENSERICQTVKVLLFKMLQSKYRQSTSELRLHSRQEKLMVRLPVTNSQPTPNSTTSSTQTHPSSSMLWRAVSTFRHYIFCKNLRAVLDEITRDVPFLVVHWLFAYHSTISFFRLTFGEKVMIDVTVDNTKIICGNSKPLASEEELKDYLLMRLCHRLISDIYDSATQLGFHLCRQDLSLYPKQNTLTEPLISLSPHHDGTIRVCTKSLAPVPGTGYRLSHFGKLAFSYQDLIRTLLNALNK